MQKSVLSNRRMGINKKRLLLFVKKVGNARLGKSD